MPASLPKVRNTIARQVVKELRDAGRDVDPLLQKAGLRRNMVARAEAWIPYAAHARLLDIAATEFEDPLYGLRLPARMEPRSFGELAYVGLASRTLEDAVQNLARYLKIHTEAWRMELQPDAEAVFIRMRPHTPEIYGFVQAAEAGIATMVAAYQSFLGERLAPKDVHFVHALRKPRKASDIEEILGCPVQFGMTEAMLAIEKSAMKRPIKTADDGLLKILKRHCAHVLELQKQEHSDFAAEVRSAIAELLPKGHAKAKLVAVKLGMPERTLYRRLAEEGTSFGEIQERLRKSLADTYIREQGLTAKETAFLLGYSDQSAFGAAYRRWTGKTPKSPPVTSQQA